MPVDEDAARCGRFEPGSVVDAGALVPHQHLAPPGTVAQQHAQTPMDGRVVDGVGQQVAHQLAQQRRVAGCPQRFRPLQRKVEPLGRNQRGQFHHGLAGNRVQVHAGQLAHALELLHLAQAEQLVGQARGAVHGMQHLLQRIAYQHVACHGGLQLGAQHGHRGTQLVGGIGQKAPLLLDPAALAVLQLGKVLHGGREF